MIGTSQEIFPRDHQYLPDDIGRSLVQSDSVEDLGELLRGLQLSQAVFLMVEMHRRGALRPVVEVMATGKSRSGGVVLKFVCVPTIHLKFSPYFECIGCLTSGLAALLLQLPEKVRIDVFVNMSQSSRQLCMDTISASSSTALELRQVAFLVNGLLNAISKSAVAAVAHIASRGTGEVCLDNKTWRVYTSCSAVLLCWNEKHAGGSLLISHLLAFLLRVGSREALPGCGEQDQPRSLLRGPRAQVPVQPRRGVGSSFNHNRGRFACGYSCATHSRCYWTCDLTPSHTIFKHFAFTRFRSKRLVFGPGRFPVRCDPWVRPSQRLRLRGPLRASRASFRRSLRQRGASRGSVMSATRTGGTRGEASAASAAAAQLVDRSGAFWGSVRTTMRRVRTRGGGASAMSAAAAWRADLGDVTRAGAWIVRRAWWSELE